MWVTCAIHCHTSSVSAPASPPRWPMAAAAVTRDPAPRARGRRSGSRVVRGVSRSRQRARRRRMACREAAAPSPPLGGRGRRHRAAAARRDRCARAAARGPPVDASSRGGVARDRRPHPQCDRDGAERGRRRDAGAPSAADRAAEARSPCARRAATLFVDPRSYGRYNWLADAVASLDTEGSARLYSTLRPRVEEAYAELGSPDTRFDATLERAIVAAARDAGRRG